MRATEQSIIEELVDLDKIRQNENEKTRQRTPLDLRTQL